MAPVRVLLVEDEPLYRELLISAFELRLPDVTIVASCGSAEEAIPMAAEAGVDVLLTDVDLGPGMTGVELGVHLRSQGRVTGVVAWARAGGRSVGGGNHGML